MQYKLIVAVCKHNGIGYRDTLPWKIKEDLKHFSKLTKGNGKNAIVMGKNTWNSIGGSPLPKRDNLILSKSLHLDNDMENKSVNTCKVFNSINALRDWCDKKNYDEVWIIGGASIYKQFLQQNVIDECVITNIDHEFTCDTFFPDIDHNHWKLVKTSAMETNTEYCVNVQYFAKV